MDLDLSLEFILGVYQLIKKSLDLGSSLTLLQNSSILSKDLMESKIQKDFGLEINFGFEINKKSPILYYTSLSQSVKR